jgi:hypothetical protein
MASHEPDGRPPSVPGLGRKVLRRAVSLGKAFLFVVIVCAAILYIGLYAGEGDAPSAGGGEVQVKGHTRKDGTQVPAHTRKRPK